MTERDDEHAVACRSDRQRSLQVLAAQPDAVFALFVHSAAALTHSDYAAISVVGEQRQWFKAAAQLAAVHVLLPQSFCAHGLDAGGAFEVADATADPRFAQHPLVTGSQQVRSYAGYPDRKSVV